MESKKYMLFGIILIILFFALVTLNKIEKPLEEFARLPRCENDVVVTEDLRSNVIKFANDYIKSGTGDSYFKNHYHFLSLDYSTTNCIFVVRYSYTYDELHSLMSISVKVFSKDKFEVIDTNAFLRPVNILLRKDEAEELAKQHNIDYDYYNIEIDIPRQTFIYRFYKETIAEGTVVVFEIDAQSKEIRELRRMPEIIPIV